MATQTAFDPRTVVHGPRRLLSHYFRRAEAEVAQRGLSLALHTDFDQLMSLNRANREVWPPLPPIFDPVQSALGDERAFWLQVCDARGSTIVAHAVRLFDLAGTLDDELRSLRVFYADPAPRLAAGERFEVMGDSARHIAGRTVHGGAFWVHPEHRHQGLASLVPRITRAYAYARWKPEFIWGFVEQRLHLGGLTRAYGPYRASDTVVSAIDWRRGTTFWLVWMTGEMMLQDVARLVDQEMVESSRLIEMPSTSISPAWRQGSRKRS